jgi:hypothetical protein
VKTLMRQVLGEWERAFLWACVVVLSLVVVFLLSRLAREKAPSQVTLTPARPPQSCLNEKTAFDFLRPEPVPDASARNPFVFSWEVPEPPAPTPPPEPPAQAVVVTPAPTETEPAVVPPAQGADEADVEIAPPAPPRRTASILYRGLYSGGRDATRQLAFVSTRESPSEASATAVLAPGQKAAGVTVKRFTPAELVVAGPTGAEVTIAVGTQVQIALE